MNTPNNKKKKESKEKIEKVFIQLIQTKDFHEELAAKYYDNKHIDYHIEFFKAGFNAIIKKWLNNNCKESPEEIHEILMSEYGNK